MKHITTKEAPAAVGPYEQAIVAEGKELLFTAGQIALTPNNALITSSIEDEIHQIMSNLEAILKAGGCSFANVVKSTIYITDPTAYPIVNRVYEEYFDGSTYPARECVGVPFLPLPDARIEISMIAERQS